MNILQSAANWQPIRACAIPAFRRINLGDITIRHHWTGDRVILHSFKHKGYWFHGKRRERRSLESVAALLSPGDTVLDIGGHIGYMALYFADLVGSAGHVYTFEPGPNNLRYIRRNIRTSKYGNIQLSENAVGQIDGQLPMWIEDLTGQNNSTIKSYSGLASTIRSHHTKPNLQAIQVPCITVDGFIQGGSIRPKFVKIDVEGAELDVLNGMRKMLADIRPALLVEVTHRSSEVERLLRGVQYRFFDENLRPIEDNATLRDNVFALPAEQLMSRLRP